ncbi:MAG: hypothetical protein H7318_09300 [Oligoflexus sp.]|nr:hypothetical protein [Oligoflexus sp.]
MFKPTSLLLCSFLSVPVFGASLTIGDPCSTKPWLTTSVEKAVGTSVGKITIDALDANSIAYLGTDAGISSIKDSVLGMNAMEVVSPTELRAYGWCYRINGIEPSLYANEVFLTSELDEIEWFFGFAHYKDGEWISMCEPTNRLKPLFICPLDKISDQESPLKQAEEPPTAALPSNDSCSSL